MVKISNQKRTQFIRDRKEPLTMTRISKELLVRHCSPTLAGLKTGNIFTCAIGNKKELHGALRRINGTLGPKGLRILPLRYSDKNVVLYLYRPAKLASDLTDHCARCILEKQGYDREDADGCLRCLIRRMRTSESIPHEIGLFLGYPPEDVKGFMENGTRACKCIGCWKVYGDEESARKTFDLYRKCTSVYCRKLSEGCSVEKLTVPCKFRENRYN